MINLSETVSVIIPHHNDSHWLGQALNSVTNQLAVVSEILVVDDHSNSEHLDAVSRLVNAVPNARLLHASRRGASAARNAGIEAATGSICAFLDCDDAWHPAKLAKQIPLLADGVSLVHCWAVDEDEAGQHTLRRPIGAATHGRVWSGRYAVTGSSSGVVARREALLRVGGFPEDLAYGEDAECWIKLRDIGRFACAPAPLVTIRVRHDSIQRSVLNGLELRLAQLEMRLSRTRRRAVSTSCVFKLALGREAAYSVVSVARRQGLASLPRESLRVSESLHKIGVGRSRLSALYWLVLAMLEIVAHNWMRLGR